MHVTNQRFTYYNYELSWTLLKVKTCHSLGTNDIRSGTSGQIFYLIFLGKIIYFFSARII